MYLRTLEIRVLKYTKMCPAKFISVRGLACPAALKLTKAILNLLTDIDVINARKKYKRRKMAFYLWICIS